MTIMDGAGVDEVLLGDGRAIVRARQAARARLSATIPRGYNPWLHLAGTAGIGLVALVAGLTQLDAPTWRELLTVPGLFVFANGVEWWVHRSVLHHRKPPFAALYDRHTPEHHMVFGYDDMAIRGWHELYRVLLPSVGVLAIVLLTAPLGAALGWLVSPNCGWLFVVSSALYVVTYELTHLAYHLPEGSLIGRLSLIRVLREHHRRHHHPRLMQRWNFNVTLPLFDALCGTVVSRGTVEQTLAEDSRATR